MRFCDNQDLISEAQSCRPTVEAAEAEESPVSAAVIAKAEPRRRRQEIGNGSVAVLDGLLQSAPKTRGPLVVVPCDGPLAHCPLLTEFNWQRLDGQDVWHSGWLVGCRCQHFFLPVS